MRILHLNQFGSYKGGAESYIADVVSALYAHGHASHLIALTPDDGGKPIAPTTYAPAPDWPSPIDATQKIISNVMTEFRPDVVYVHVVYHPALVKWIAQNLPTVAYIHAPYPVCPGSAQYLRRSARVCPHTAGAICLLNAQLEKCCWGRHPAKHLRLLQCTRQFVTAHLQLRRIFVGSEFMRGLMIRGGAPAGSVQRLAPVLINSQEIPQQITEVSATVLYAGRLTSEKGIKHLIQALAMVSAPWRLLVAGDGPERKPAEALARQLGVTNQIEFLGWLEHPEMVQRYRQCTVVAFPSLWPEPFGRVGPEAYIHGKPVVAYATGGIPDWLIDGRTGYLITPGNITQFSQRLQYLLESPDLCRQLGTQARQMALEQWAADRHVAQLLETFEVALELGA